MERLHSQEKQIRDLYSEHLKPLIYKGSVIKCEKVRIFPDVGKPVYRSVYINFGCKRDFSLSDKDQIKDIKKRWYVYYEYLLPSGKYKGFKAYAHINRHHTISVRYKAANLLLDHILGMLEQGYSPLGRDGSEVVSTNPAQTIYGMSIIDGLKWAYEAHKPKVSHGTFGNIRQVYNRVIKVIPEVGFTEITVGEFKKSHWKVLMEYIQKEEKISDKRYNYFIAMMQSLYCEFLDMDVLEQSPLENFNKKKVSAQVKFKTLTVDEKKKVHAQLKKEHPNFLRWYLILYYTGMRPQELLATQKSNYFPLEACFRFKENEKIIIRNKEYNKTKTKKERYIPIPPPAMLLMQEIDMEKVSDNIFLFSDGFLPGNRALHSLEATKIWRNLIINDKTGLGIDKKLYGVKHLGIDDKLDNNIDIHAIQSGIGHTSNAMTQRYASTLKNQHQRQINEKTKGFLEE